VKSLFFGQVQMAVRPLPECVKSAVCRRTGARHNTRHGLWRLLAKPLDMRPCSVTNMRHCHDGLLCRYRRGPRLCFRLTSHTTLLPVHWWCSLTFCPGGRLRSRQIWDYLPLAGTGIGPRSTERCPNWHTRPTAHPCSFQ